MLDFHNKPRNNYTILAKEGQVLPVEDSRGKSGDEFNG
jgi:hypothetical protein